MSRKNTNNINNELPIVDPAIPMQNNPPETELHIGKKLTGILFDLNQTNLVNLMQRCENKFSSLWIELLETERTMYRFLGITGERAQGDKNPRGIKGDMGKAAFRRFLGRDPGKTNKYLQHQLPVFYTLLYCHTKEADEAWEIFGDGGSLVSNVLYPMLKKFLKNFFMSTLRMDETKQNEKLESKDLSVVLSCFVVLFNYDMLVNDMLVWVETSEALDGAGAEEQARAV
ncbi:MAG: hypothetical protein K6F27_05645 [Ruminococcus sp.]|nr:hypothetical protein [Ruminococcus sp.]